MLKYITVFASFIFLSACASSGENSAQKHDGSLKLFNALYHIPESAQSASCVVDAKIAVVEKAAFLALLDDIIKETRNNILYSDITQRDRVVYVASVECDNLDGDGAFAAKNYFDNVLSVTKTKAMDYPFIASSAEISREEWIVDLKDAAFAAEFELPERSSDEQAETFWQEFTCVIETASKTRFKYGLPFSRVSRADNTFVFVSNIQPDDSDLADYLMNYAYDTCGYEFDYEIRKLTENEMAFTLRAIARVSMQ